MSDEIYEQYTRLRTERPSDGVLLITLDDPDKLNVTDATMDRVTPAAFAATV